MNKRPLSVTIIGCLYIVTGAIGFTTTTVVDVVVGLELVVLG